MFFQQLNWFSVSDRLFVFFTCIVPLTTLFLFGVLFAEYKTEMRKRRKNKKRR